MKERHKEFFIKCNNYNFSNSRVRKKTLDSKCPNCGYRRDLTLIEVDKIEKNCI